uniref:Uncharacterized protein n=1 Tax=Parastrongyloides trichosuri TaxID=131310 RepID=A0A0N4Z3E4_PARTI
MYLQFFILLFFKIFQNIGGQCDVYSNYFLLGLLTFNELKTEICQNASDDCIYISLNAPGLAIGTFSGCSTDVKDTLQKIIQERLDVEEAFKQFYYSDSNTLNISHLCNVCFYDI